MEFLISWFEACDSLLLYGACEETRAFDESPRETPIVHLMHTARGAPVLQNGSRASVCLLNTQCNASFHALGNIETMGVDNALSSQLNGRAGAWQAAG